MSELVSCICCVYNRAPNYLFLVEEAVESFIRQDYPDKELIIINDTPGQNLFFDHDQVVVYNEERRFSTLGEKNNYGIEVSKGSLICIWDDDDISLPFRISKSVEVLEMADYWNPSRYWVLDERGLHHDHPLGIAHGLSIFRRNAWSSAGRYESISAGYDLILDEKFKKNFNVVYHDISLDEWFYIYRFGISPYHVSSLNPADFYYAEHGKKPIIPGEFVIYPKWRVDYGEMCSLRIESLKLNTCITET